MRRLAINTSLVFAGALAGWCLRDLATGDTPPFAADVVESPVVATTASSSARYSTTTAINVPSEPESGISPQSFSFAELLEQQDYGRAIEYYETAIQLDAQNQARLKSELLAYLSARVQACSDVSFVNLVDLWLDAYYADIEVLLLLADNQRYCGATEEAASTLQIARTYAVTPGQLERVSIAIDRLVEATDQYLAKQGEWIKLLGFYEFIDVIDLATRTSQLRRASLYEKIGEVQQGRELLSKLLENDDGMDAEWTASLHRQWGNSSRQPLAPDRPHHEIPLTRRGNHFLVSASINDGDPLALVIDTGATVTTLSRVRFEQTDNVGFRYIGTQLFSTPNGMTRGEIYRVDSMQLEGIRLSDIEIAVLDFKSSTDLDGLLGMNVLRNYRFEIDQDREILFLSPRP